MRAVVSDVLGRVRLIDVWNDTVVDVIGGNEEDKPDRSWSIGALQLTSPSEATVIHDNGKASFFEFDNNTRISILDLNEPAKGYSLKSFGENHVACFNGRVTIFNQNDVLGSFETITGTCANSFENTAFYGRYDEKAKAYDITAQKEKWEAAPAPLDELKLVVKDRDKSIEFMSENVVLVGQTDGAMLIYDLRSGNEAIRNLPPIFPEFPVATILKLSDDEFICGDTTGLTRVCSLLDPLGVKGGRSFKGMTGGVLAFAAHPSLPLVGALGASRTLHLYDRSRPNKEPTRVAFTKTMPTAAALFGDEVPEANSSDEEWENLPEDGEGVWDNFTPCPQAKMTANE